MKEKSSADDDKAIRVLTDADLTQISGGVGGDPDRALKKATKRKA